MWKSIKKLLAALRASIASLLDLPKSLFEELMERLNELQAMPMKAVRDGVPRVTEARDAIREILDERAPEMENEAPTPPEPSTEEVRRLGESVQEMARRRFDDMTLGASALPDEIQLYVMSLTRSELRLIARSTAVEVGRHVLGTPFVRDYGDAMLRLPDPVYDADQAKELARMKAERDASLREWAEFESACERDPYKTPGPGESPEYHALLWGLDMPKAA